MCKYGGNKMKKSVDSNNKDRRSMKADRVLECFLELSSLTKLPRIGWILAGVPEPESVSDHCYETALFAYILSKYVDEEFDMKKVLLMALFHEIGEARLTDLPRRSKNYIGKTKHQAERKAAIDIVHDVADEIIDLLDEFHSLSTPEARLVEAAEELQIIFKAMVYAKENKGDMSEYRNDIEKYDPQGFECAEQITFLIKEKLYGYLGKKKYWEVGYKQRDK